MELALVYYGGKTEKITDIEKFEFRTNKVANWIRIKFKDGHIATLFNISVIKT